MATIKDDSAKPPAKAAPAKVEPAAAAPKTPAPAKTASPAKGPRVSTCVINDGRGTHVGNAVNGKVCSYHAMQYDAAGNPR